MDSPDKRFFVLRSSEAEKRGLVPKDIYVCFMLFEHTLDGTRLVNTDGGDPDDQTLDRDWAWVVDELNRAYAQGCADGEARVGTKGG